MNIIYNVKYTELCMVREADIMDAETEMGGITMKYCKQCGKEMADDLKRCPNCGTATGIGTFSKWNVGLIACDVVGIWMLFLGWVKISALGMSKTVSPMQMAGYLKDADNMFGQYLAGYSDKINLIMLGGVCLIAAYAVSGVLTLLKNDYAFFVGMIAHLVMVFFSGEVVSFGNKVEAVTYQMISVSGIVYLVFLLSMVASIMCFYVFAFHPELVRNNS